MLLLQIYMNAQMAAFVWQIITYMSKQCYLVFSVNITGAFVPFSLVGRDVKFSPSIKLC